MKGAAPRIFLLGCFAATVVLCVFGPKANAAELHLPATVLAGQGFSISLDGSGQATFYLLGPDHVVRRAVNLGGELQIASSDVRTAGHYVIVVCSSACTSSTFEVKAAQPGNLSFFLHPSRVPVASRDAISASAFVFDQYFNLVLIPVEVDFRIKPASGATLSRRSSAQNGVAWIHLDSTSREGPVQVTAETGNASETRLVQQIAADACSLRMKATENRNIVAIETDPVRDCSGNPLPDGTIVSFTKIDQAGRSTADVPIKKGVARTQFNLAGPARMSVACGVVVGNELVLNGKL